MYKYIYVNNYFSCPRSAGIFLCFLLTYKARENFALFCCRISSKVLFHILTNCICKVVLILWLRLSLWTLRVFITCLLKKRDLPQKKRLFHTQINWSIFKWGFCNFSLECCVQLCVPAKTTGSERPQATTVWILRKAKSSCCGFCLFGVLFYVWRHVELQGKTRSKPSFFSWEKSRLYRLPSKCKNSDTLFRRKCHQNVASWVLHFFNRRQLL